MTTRKHGIKAPPIPKSENPAVTLAVQDNQIKALIDRVVDLAKERDQFKHLHELSESHEKHMQEIFDRTCKEFDEQVKAHTRLLGWQDCAREFFQIIVEK